MSKDAGEKKAMPKGGRKGGTQFPQINLVDAERYCKKLVSKTHNGPQPSTVILPGVFDSATDRGMIRASAMKQYRLMKGEATAYEATTLAKDLNAAPPEDKPKHLQTAFLNAKVFKSLYDTFVDDTVSLAKLRQQAAQLDVHPDNQELAVRLFVESALAAGLATQNGDNVTVSRASVTPIKAQAEQVTAETPPPAETNHAQGGNEEHSQKGPSSADNGSGTQSARAVINVNVTLDSSLDTEKLEKQLKLLRQYGAI